MKEFINKTVLVTGATGFIGSHIVDSLMKLENVHVLALSRSRNKLEKGFSEYLNHNRFSYIAQNITEPLKVEDSVDYIFHAAGPMEGKIIRDYPVDVINPNILGTINCLEFLKKQEKEKLIKGRMVLFSSVTVYGNHSCNELTAVEDITNVTENLNCVSAPYSQSKRMSEVITLAYAKQFGIDAVISRFSTVYGATRFIPETAFFEFIRKGIAGEDIILNSAGLPRRDNIYIDDAVKGVLLIAAAGKSGEAYNVSSNGDLDNYNSVDEIAQVIASAANEGRDAKTKVLFKEPFNGVRKAGLKLDNKKLKGLGWNVETYLDEGIKKTLMQID